ncbi:MAG: ATP-dependent 6-phosphofructokinase, partial [Proteobacteria bacterium]|nr:ATP-dependent 6-phosphofructokinase [Pseudomonadota bacterium]
AHVELSLTDFTGPVLRMGGTILETTTRGDPYAFPMPDGSVADRSEEVIGGYRELDLDALVVIGGDGSFRIMRRLADDGGINLVGIPKTIDNDVSKTENAIGFITAVNVATEALDRLQPTAASHSRLMILEVMGRDAGHIALASGLAGGADVILIPEIPYRIETIAAKIEALRKKEGRNFALMVVAEGVKTETGEAVTVTDTDAEGKPRYGGIGTYLGGRLPALTGADTRVTTLGHVQRGGVPSATDRILGSAFGVRAVDLVAEGRFGRMVVWQNRRVVDVPIEDAIATHRRVDVDGDLVKTARGLGVCFGDE